MRGYIPAFVAGLMAALLAMPVSADDVTGEEEILCTTVRVMECFGDGGCDEGSPEVWNLPRFTRVDLEAKTLTTTEASGRSRTTPIERVENDGADVVLQGAEAGRAFSILLDADTGTAYGAIALEGSVLALFAYCTPLISD